MPCETYDGIPCGPRRATGGSRLATTAPGGFGDLLRQVHHPAAIKEEGAEEPPEPLYDALRCVHKLPMSGRWPREHRHRYPFYLTHPKVMLDIPYIHHPQAVPAACH